MLKKLTLATATFLLINCVSANAAALYIGPSLSFNNITSSNSSYRGLSPHFSLGYGDNLSNDFYLAGELFGTPGSIDISNNNVSGSGTSIKTTHSYGASIIPSVMLSSAAMLYGRLGIISSYFTDQDKNVFGEQAGLGIQTNLTPTWDIRSEYTYTSYRSISGIGSPNGDGFSVGLVHKFN